MMSAEKIQTKPANNDNQASGNRKTGSSPRPPEPALKCPRCDSPNTKFCYYNNYNLSQPRHFCKTCRRYWTKGGALRNVPVGGGCRKNKKIKSSSRLSDDSKDSAGGSFDSTGFKFFHGVSPAMEFQYGRLPFSRLNSPSSSNVYNHLFSFGDLSSTGPTTTTTAPVNPSCFDIDGVPSSTSLMGFNFPVRQGDHHQSGGGGFNWGIQENPMNVHSNLASSIESLSSINQDLHWKLQQQRLAMLYVGESHNESHSSSISSMQGGMQLDNQLAQNQQAIAFQNLEISKPEACAVGNQLMKSGIGGCGNDTTTNTTEWLFENTYTPATTTTSSNSNGNGNGNEGIITNWNGVQVWSDMQRYSDLPQ